MKKSDRKKRAPKRVLRLPDLDYAKRSALNTLGSPASKRRKLANSVPSLDGHGHSLGAARPVCDSEFAGQPSQMLVGCPEMRVGDKGGSEQMRIDPPNASAVQLV